MKKIFLPMFLLIAYFTLGQEKSDVPVKNPKPQRQTRRTTSSSIGIGIDIGGIIRSIKNKKNCNQLNIIFPPNKAKFTALINNNPDGSMAEMSNWKTKPNFRWTSSKPEQVKNYIIELVQIEKKKKRTIYQAETTENFFIWPNDLSYESIDLKANKGKLKFEFYVMAVLQNAPKCQNALATTSFEVIKQFVDNPVSNPTSDEKIVVSDKVVTKINTQKNVGFEVESGITDPTKKANQNDIIALTPRNGMSYQIDQLPDFTWRTTRMIEGANYKLELFEVLPGNKLERIQIEENLGDTPMLSASSCDCKKLADVIMRNGNKQNDQPKPRGGNYMWKVTETKTGISSNPSYFSISSCDVNLQISDETIECLGYEGTNRKYKICFSSTYQSSTGDLTFNQPDSGLIVKDQNNSTIAATLVGINTSLQTQIGSTSSTVNYCFEVLVSAGVTDINFRLKGDDLDSDPDPDAICRASVALNFDTLPNCLCDDCNNIELSFDNFNISPNGNAGNQFNFNGNINVNVPIYGIEFQIQSYSYSANPSACTTGVSSVEESGMILMPGTTINGSTGLQLFNETASGSPNSNNNATKDIKYISNAALTGAIPVNLTIGLPGPISGLNPSCCVIDYTVCIKVKIFYGEGNCKSCVFTQCFNFNNQ